LQETVEIAKDVKETRGVGLLRKDAQFPKKAAYHPSFASIACSK
jgi:hypothetical protein